MDSVRSFLGLWIALTVGILGYAVLDLRHNPWLYDEHNFTMTPDLARIGDLVHWGGRLLKERAFGLLVCNAIVVAGLLALATGAVVRTLRTIVFRSDGERAGRTDLAERLSLPPG